MAPDVVIGALILDFDGLILDTETPALESWREIYAEFGRHVPVAEWSTTLGGTGAGGFDPLAHLAGLVGSAFDPEVVFARRQARKLALCDGLPLMPGVRSLLDQAAAQGLPCAVASSSGRAWVEPWLRRHDIIDRFACVRTADDVGRTKPAPDLFLSAAEGLDVAPRACLVFEDSPNGVRAALAAGMRCVVVPCPLTATLELPDADLRLPSLAGVRLSDLVIRIR
jgi:HAD superfamily hydrolase (TIGR01509 family)